MCLLFLKRIFQFLCNLHFPDHIGLAVKIGMERRNKLIFWVNFLDHTPDTSCVYRRKSLPFSTLTAEVTPESAPPKTLLVLDPAPTHKVCPCSALRCPVSSSQGPPFQVIDSSGEKR